jgi:hypothetical protein
LLLCGQNRIKLSDNYQALISLLLPEGILDYFDIVNLSNDKSGLSIYLDEKNLPPVGYTAADLESKGFLSEIRVQDFPIRGKKAFLCIRRRRWEVISNKEIISRDWKLVQSGTRMTKEFAAFLKGIFG